MAASLARSGEEHIDDKYSLVRPLTRSSIGDAHEGEHLVLGKPVTLFVLDPDLARRDPVRDGFLAHARALARVAHPNVAEVQDLGVADDGTTYVASGLTEGETLRELLERDAPLPVDEACDLALQILAGLAAGHARGLFHGRLDPSTIRIVPLRTDHHLVKVEDLGFHVAIAGKLVDRERARDLLGSAAYLAPEVERGAKADARSDVYGVAALLFEMLAGRPAFDDDGEDLTGRLRGGRRSLTDVNPLVASVLARAVDGALAEDPDGRPQSAQELALLLRPFVAADRATSVAPTPRPVKGVAAPTDVKIHIPLGAMGVPSREPPGVMTESLLLEPRFPKAPSAPRLDSLRSLFASLTPSIGPTAGGDDPPQLDSAWEGVRHSHWAERVKSSAVATIAGFSIGIGIAWLLGVL